MENDTYFSGIRREYQEAIDFSSELYGNIAARLDGILHGRVIDFGNGGILHYETSRLSSLLCVDLVPHSMPGRANVEFVQGDFYEFPFPADADVVLAQFLIHHLDDDRRLAEALTRLRKGLRPGARLVIVEMLMPEWMEKAQAALRPVYRAALRRLDKPDLRFFSRRSLQRLLQQAGFTSVEAHAVTIGRRIAPAPVLFPRLRIPGKLYPLKCVVVEAVAT